MDFHEFSTSIGDLDVGEKVWQVLSLIGVSIKQGDILPTIDSK